MKFKVTVSDRPGGISELCKLISSLGVSIKDVIHERAWVASDVFSVEVRQLIKNFTPLLIFFLFQVKVVCETRDYAHGIELRDMLNSRYKRVKFDSVPLRNTVSSTSD